jgi:hypothetical protein
MTEPDEILNQGAKTGKFDSHMPKNIKERHAPLRQRIEAFARLIPGSEAIDDLIQTPEQQQAKKADFFFQDRRIVCEIKNLETDTSAKIEPVIEPHKRRPEWPYFIGTRPLSHLIQNFPDKEEINREVFEAVSSAIAKDVAEADRQIRATKSAFGCPASGGLLILGSEFVEVLSPDIIGSRVARTLNKKSPDGNLQYRAINYVWIIIENFFVEVKPGITAAPSFIIRQAVPDHAGVEPFVDSLQSRWAAFHGIPFARYNGTDIRALKFRHHQAKVKIRL